MTRKELSQLYHLNREIEQDKRRLAEYEAAATSKTPKITGLPHINSISDKTAIAAEIADMKALIEAKIKISVALYNQIMRYIATIDDPLLREIVTLRNVNGLPWVQIPHHVAGKMTVSAVKMIYFRGIPK